MVFTCHVCNFSYALKPSHARKNQGGQQHTQNGGDCVQCGAGNDAIY